MADISLILYQENKAFDISQLVESIKWKGRKSSAARSINVTLMDTEKIKSGIDATRGNHLIFSFKGKELFRGMVMSQQQPCKT